MTTNQDKIKYLKRFTLLDKEIDRKIQEIGYWRAKLIKITPKYTDELKTPGGSIYGKTEELVAKIVDIDSEIIADVGRLIRLRQEIKATIKAVEDERERMLLAYRYLDGMTFEWIAAEMGYSWRHIHRLHSRALSNVEITTMS